MTVTILLHLYEELWFLLKIAQAWVINIAKLSTEDRTQLTGQNSCAIYW